MKILILANNDIGLYKFRKELLEELLKKNEVFISLPNGDYIADMEKMGCEFIDTEFSRRGKNPFAELKLLNFYKKVIKRIKPDAVLTYTVKPNIYGGIACASLKVPYIENITGLGTALEKHGLLQKVTLFLYRKALKSAHMVFFQNTENLDFMINHKIVKGKYDLLPGSGVNLTAYPLIEYPNGETINFVFIARIMKEKGIDQYLDAAKVIKDRHPNTRFHVCGFCEDEYKGELNKLVGTGIVEYHGLVKDMKRIYEMASCIIHPTYYPEGLSNVLLESCASGRPIIASNRSGCKEVVEDGINGFLVEQKNSQDLIDKIELFLSLSNEKMKEMGLAGRRKVENEFDRTIVITKYIKTLEQVYE